MRALVLLGLGLAVLTIPAACGSEGEETLGRDEYVELYVELLRVSAEADDSTEAARKRAEVLERHGHSLEELSAFADRHAADPDYMAEVWLTIERRLRADTAQDEPADDAVSGRDPNASAGLHRATQRPVG